MTSHQNHLFLTDGYSDVAFIVFPSGDAICSLAIDGFMDCGSKNHPRHVMGSKWWKHCRYDISTPSNPILTARVLSSHWSEERIPVDFVVAGSSVYSLIYEPSGDDEQWSLLTHSIDSNGNLSEKDDSGNHQRGQPRAPRLAKINS